MATLIKTNNAVDLIVGEPDYPIEPFVKDTIIQAVQDDHNQYAQYPELAKTTAGTYAEKFNRTINPDNQIIFTSGANEAILFALQGLCDIGDEVILLEPAFPTYTPMVATAGAKPIFVPLKHDDWSIDYEGLENAINEKTKILIFNNPHNPTGKLYDENEIRQLADFLQRHPQITVISDEVYEEHVYGSAKMFRMGEAMWDRCISVYSGGKLFSVTGWRVGWAIGPANLISTMRTPQATSSIQVNTPAQVAFHNLLQQAQDPYKGYPNYYKWLQAGFEKRSALLHDILSTPNSKLPVISEPVSSGLYICPKINASQLDIFRYCEDGVSLSHGFCRWLPEELGISALPASVFYSPEHQYLGSNYVRISFSKSEESLEEVRNRIK